MFKNLYDKFSHWYRGGTIYFYSDPHFNDPEMVYLRKDYIGDEEQVKAINRKIGKNDTIVILGDIGDVEWVKKIRGYKVLVMGNHDAGASNYKREVTGEIAYYNEDGSQMYKTETVRDNRLFDEVYEGPVFISDKILLSHEPIYLPFAVCFSGHDHSNWNQNPNVINFCAEHINYTPVALKDIVNSGVLNKVPNIHRETINHAIERKEKRKRG